MGDDGVSLDANYHANEYDGEWIWAMRQWQQEGGKELYRKVALWGYETDGGRASPFWQNPQTIMSPKGAELFAGWKKTKRPFTAEEVVTGVWEKYGDETGDYQDKHQLRLFPDGTLREHELGKPEPSWGGKWELVNGEILRLLINDYELDVVAAKEGNRHSGVNFVPYHNHPVTYFTMIHLP